MNIPAELRYTKDHEWIRVEGNDAIIGITDFAQSELGDIVFVDISSEGQDLAHEAVFGTVEAVKTVSDLFMPVSGKVTTVNPGLADDPASVNTDPYGKGWMVKVTMSDPKEVEGLLTADQYKALVGALIPTRMSRYLRLASAWALLIAVLCLTPGKALPSWQWADLLSVDKLIHAIMFGMLTYLMARGLRERSTNELSEGRILLIAGAISVVYGGTMEVLQEPPGLGRRGDLVDLTANTVGALAGAYWVKRRWARRSTPANAM